MNVSLPELCHSLMERSPVPMAELEGAGHVLRYVNPAFCRLVGKAKEALVARPFTETVQEGDGCLAVLDRVYRTGEPETHTELEHPQQHPAYWSYAAWPVLDVQQRPVGVMMQVIETTLFHQQAGAMNQALLLSSVRQHEHAEAVETLNDQLQAEIATRGCLEKQLQEQAEALREADRKKDEFLALLAHELRNPLSSVLNAVQILKLRGSDLPELTLARDVIERQVWQLTRLVDDLLDVSRITSGKVRLQREPIELAAVVARAVETSRPLIETRRHQLTIDLPPQPLWVDGDLIRLAQVVANLLNNAAKYTPEGGRIGLLVERNGREAVLRVRDNGVGLAADMLSRVFDLFTQADQSLAHAQGGLGIGLNLVRRLVEMHGGNVQAASAGPGRGSEFVVRLPLANGRLEPGSR